MYTYVAIIAVYLTTQNKNFIAVYIRIAMYNDMSINRKRSVQWCMCPVARMHAGYSKCFQ